MPTVRSTVPYADFIAGRDVDSALHREDGAAGYCIGVVPAVREGDEAIDEATYAAEAEAIAAHNAALPEPDPPASPPDVNGYLLAAMGALASANDPYGLIRGNQVLAAWPGFAIALNAANWAVARAILAAALSAATVSQDEYDALAALFDTYAIPES